MQYRYQTQSYKQGPKTKNGISYGRVSTFDQAFNRDGARREDASPEAQRSRCADHVVFLNAKKGGNYKILEHISDEGFSGKNTNRPGYQKMCDLIASKTIEFVVATELSRISRSVVDFLELVSHCEKHNVDLLIIGLDLDTSSPIGRVMVIILVALAQFEREMTSQRVKENALNRLLKDGKINGAAEILGLDRDPARAGHFLINYDELLKVEQILKLFLKFSSKNKVLSEAKKLGLTGKEGRELTHHLVDSVIENAKWRYRGLWYANKENEHRDPSELPETKRFQIVELPHGPLIEDKLLSQVEHKLADTFENRKRSGKDGRIYLLTHILQYEDGSTYYGGSAKGRQYFYYYSKGEGPNIQCEDIEKVVIDRIKAYFKGSEIFAKLVENAVKKRIEELPKIDHEITRIQNELHDLDDANKDLREQLREKELRSRSSFMNWLEDEVEKIREQKQRKEQDIEILFLARADLMKKSGLESLEQTASEFIAKFDQLTGVQKRSFIERMISRVVIKKDNKIELHVLWDSSTRFRQGFSGQAAQDDGNEKLENNKNVANSVYYEGQKKVVCETTFFETISSIREQNGGRDGTRTRGLRRDRAAL